MKAIKHANVWCNKENLGWKGLVKKQDKNRYCAIHVQFQVFKAEQKQKKTKKPHKSIHGHKSIIQPEEMRSVANT